MNSKKGTTSACAENTLFNKRHDEEIGNYLRVRGEYGVGGCLVRAVPELPPRARRILARSGAVSYPWGTTSACAENTGLGRSLAQSPGNYLRVRGEYTPHRSARYLIGELPPRARRIHAKHRNPNPRAGTTSACAENTPSTTSTACCARNYLRVRGEYVRYAWA